MYDTRYISYDTYYIVYKKFSIVKSYSKCLWIVRYISVYHMNHIVSVNRTYCTIHRHVGWKWVFLLKFVVLFDLNKLLDFFNTKLLGNLIESNSHEPPPLLFLLQNLNYIHNTHFHMCKFIFYAINNVIKWRYNYLLFFYYYYESKKLECQEKKYKEKIIWIEKTKQKQ